MMVNEGLVIFLIFFGASLLHALAGGDWLPAAFWILMAAVFWGMERFGSRRGSVKRSESRPDVWP
jgi:hypothetical protein